MLKISTFCSGIGSPEQAIKNLGVEHKVVITAEIDKYARQTYLANHDTDLMLEDMTKCDYVGKEYYSDINISGLPCQAFSLAGKRLGELDPRGLLFFDFYRYVKNQQPKIFVIENVKGLLSADGGKVIQNWLLLLGNSVNGHSQMFNHPDSLEYNLHHTVLNSKNFGVPQNRERVFIVGIRKDLPNDFRFPVGWKLDKRLKDVLETNVDEKYYLSEKMLKGFINHSDNMKQKGNGFKFEPISDIDNEIASCVTARVFKMGIDDNYIQVYEAGEIKTERKNIQQLEPRTDGITNTITSVQKDNLIVEPEIVIEQLSENKKWGNSVRQQDRVYSDNGLMACITAARTESKVNVFTNSRIRRLTPLEVARLQAFPDNFIWPVSDSQRYKQCGNSITTTVIGAIIKNLLHLL